MVPKENDLVLVWILRIALYLQLILGATKFASMHSNFNLPDTVWDWHILLAVVIVVAAFFALRPLPRVPMNPVRVTARYLPWLPFLIGLGFLFGLISGITLIVIHMALGVITIGFVEIAAAQQRRALAL